MELVSRRSIPKGKHQTLDFLNMWLDILVSGTQSSYISYTHQTSEYSSFFYLSLTCYDSFLHGCMAWDALAAGQRTLEGKPNHMEKYAWILPSWSQSLLSYFALIVVLPASWFEVKRGINSFLSSFVWLRKIQGKNCKGIAAWKR